MTITLVLGGARSGKTAHALAAAEAASVRRAYIATAEALDEEMAERIARHQSERGAGWRTIETPLELVGVLAADTSQDEVILVDCLTLWLSNLMHHGRDVDAESEALCYCLARLDRNVILVSNEVGLGLVPDTPLGRRFRDAQGRLNQAVAAVSDKVEFMAAGLSLRLKG